jgi:hypothetical protein
MILMDLQLQVGAKKGGVALSGPRERNWKEQRLQQGVAL